MATVGTADCTPLWEDTHTQCLAVCTAQLLRSVCLSAVVVTDLEDGLRLLWVLSVHAPLDLQTPDRQTLLSGEEEGKSVTAETS